MKNEIFTLLVFSSLCGHPHQCQAQQQQTPATTGKTWAKDEANKPGADIRAMRLAARKIYGDKAEAETKAQAILDTPSGSGWGAHWFEYLPPCPDKEGDIDKGEWEDDNPRMAAFFHPGSKSYRSKRHYRSGYGNGQDDSWHGAQPTYRAGNLITDPWDPGAGSPDFHISGTLPHLNTDVFPWFWLGSKTYNQYWVTQKGTQEAFHVLVGCTDPTTGASPFVSGTHPKAGGALLESKGWRDTMLDVYIGDVVELRSLGKVNWGYQGETCDADGDLSTEDKPLLREMLSPRPFNTRIGLLLGAVLSNDHLPRPKDLQVFRVGKSCDYVVQKEGRLWLGINDGTTSNNTGYFDVKIQRLRK